MLTDSSRTWVSQTNNNDNDNTTICIIIIIIITITLLLLLLLLALRASRPERPAPTGGTDSHNMHTYIHAYMPTYLHTYIHVHIHIHIHIDIYIYIYTHFRTFPIQQVEGLAYRSIQGIKPTSKFNEVGRLHLHISGTDSNGSGGTDSTRRMCLFCITKIISCYCTVKTI